jgi:hypothetical protein
VPTFITRATLTDDFESSLAAFAIEASRLAIPEAFSNAVSGTFEKLKIIWMIGSVDVGGVMDVSAFGDVGGVTDVSAFGDLDGSDEDVDVPFVTLGVIVVEMDIDDVSDMVRISVCVAVEVTEEEAPNDKDAVGDSETVSDVVPEGVTEGEAPSESVAVGEGVDDADCSAIVTLDDGVKYLEIGIPLVYKLRSVPTSSVSQRPSTEVLTPPDMIEDGIT